MEYGIKIAKPGLDVTIAQRKDLVFYNKEKFLKAFLQGSLAINVTANGTYKAEITHGLGYFPKFFFMATYDPNHPERRFPGKVAATGVHGSISSDGYVTPTAFVFQWKDSSSGDFRAFPYIINCYYYIFYDQLGRI